MRLSRHRGALLRAAAGFTALVGISAVVLLGSPDAGRADERSGTVSEAGPTP